MKSNCPVCGSQALAAGVHRSNLPIFQNVVWDTAEAARSAPAAPFVLSTCADCGFSFNSSFDNAKMIYDARYDNNVPSATFRAYYQSLIDMLIDRFQIESGTVYDVGCGKGEFLEMFCASAPNVNGIGIDPSCTPVERSNFKLIQAFLEPSHFSGDTRLVVVRHVLEHIEDPVAFMRMIRECVPDVPVYVEVPDFDWILKHTAFWDFCYEHCNYFTPKSLAACLRAAGFDVVDQQPSFGEQYQWALCKPGEAHAPAPGNGADEVAAVAAYLDTERAHIDALKALIGRSPSGVVVWGMATKGVVLCSMLGEGVLGGVDVNVKKQGKFAAGSGVAIRDPDWTLTLPEGTPTLVMNPNYFREIQATVAELGAPLELLPL